MNAARKAMNTALSRGVSTRLRPSAPNPTITPALPRRVSHAMRNPANDRAAGIPDRSTSA
jgi:hypothetical protein